MSFILSSPAAVPALPASPGSRAPARSGDQDASQPGSFGDAMARSREAGQDKAAAPAARPATPKPVRRAADAEKEMPQGSVNPMAALLIPLDSRLAATATTTATATATALPGGAAAAGPTDKPAIPADAGLGGLLAAAPAAPGALAGASGAVVETGAQAALAPGLGALTPKGADLAPAQARETPASPPGAQAALASGLATLIPKGADLAPAQARETPASPGLPVTTDARAVTAQADAAGAGLPDSSSGKGGDGSSSAAAALGERAELSPQAVDTPLFAGAGAALQQPGSPVASNAPAPVASALLAPDVGSSEWGKALGQQVISLSAADQQVAELQLNPPGLGPLKVTLSLSDQQMQAAFVSAHSSVRAAVEAALPQLRALLAESGISLGQTSVGAESQPQTAFSNAQGDSGNAPPRASYRDREADKAALLFSAQPAAAQRSAGQGRRIDIYA